MRLYRDNFRPSPAHDKPYAILATHVICADSDAEAERLATTADLNIVRRAKGEHLPLASPEDAAAYDYTPSTARASRRTAPAWRSARRRPSRRGSTPLIDATQADELMVTTMVFSHEARKHSYELAGAGVLLTVIPGRRAQGASPE